MSDSESVHSSDDGGVAENDLNNPDIVTKYRLAGDFANYALQEVLSASKPGVRIVELCKLGDAKILEKTNTVYNKPVIIKGEKVKVEKGVAFPTSVSVNHILSSFCPSDNDETILQVGDVAKIELGVHVDGYIATVVHTIVVGESVATGRKADVMLAAQNALEASLRLLRPGTSSLEVARLAKKLGDAYSVSAVEAVGCNNMKRFVYQGAKEAPIKPKVEEKIEAFTVEEGDVFSMEMSFTSGPDGKVSGKDGIVTVYRRAVDVTYMLKLKASRTLFSEINTNAPVMPFCIRDFELKLGAQAKLGLKEIVEHQLLNQYPVFVDKPGEVIATFHTTALVLSSGVLRLTGAPYQAAQSDRTLTDPDVIALLSQPLKPKKKSKGKKKAGDKAGEEKDEE